MKESQDWPYPAARKRGMTFGVVMYSKEPGINIRGNHPDPNEGVSYGKQKGRPLKKPKGCKVLTTTWDRKGGIMQYNCWR